MIAMVPVPPLVGSLYAVLIWDGEYPVGVVPVACGEYPSDVVPISCGEYPIGAAPACAGRIWKSGCAVQSLAVVVAFAVDAIPEKLITRTSIAKTMKVLALFPYFLINEVHFYGFYLDLTFNIILQGILRIDGINYSD